MRLSQLSKLKNVISVFHQLTLVYMNLNNTVERLKNTRSHSFSPLCATFIDYHLARFEMHLLYAVSLQLLLQSISHHTYACNRLYREKKSQ